MTAISHELSLIHNLRNASVWHKANCNDAQCNVSIFALKEAARFIHRYMIALDMKESELLEAKRLINEMEIT